MSLKNDKYARHMVSAHLSQGVRSVTTRLIYDSLSTIDSLGDIMESLMEKMEYEDDLRIVICEPYCFTVLSIVELGVMKH